MLTILLHIWEFLAILALLCRTGIVMHYNRLHFTGTQRSPWYDPSRPSAWLLLEIWLPALLAAEIIILFLHLALTAQLLNIPLLSPAAARATFLASDYGLLWSALFALTCLLQGLHWHNTHALKLPFSAYQGQHRWSETLPELCLVGLIFCLELFTFFTPPILFSAATTRPLPTSTVTSTATAQTRQVGNFSVIFQVTPGQTDATNTVTVQILNARQQPVINARITVNVNMELMDMGTTRTPMAGHGTLYTATFAPYGTFSMSGVWDIKLTMQIPGQPPLNTTFTVLFLASQE